MVNVETAHVDFKDSIKSVAVAGDDDEKHLNVLADLMYEEDKSKQAAAATETEGVSYNPPFIVELVFEIIAQAVFGTSLFIHLSLTDKNIHSFLSFRVAGGRALLEGILNCCSSNCSRSS